MSFSVKTILPRTLFGRSLLILIMPVLLVQVVTTYIFFERHWEKMTDRLAFSVAGEIAVMADQIDDGADDAEIAQMTSYAARSLDLLTSFERGAALVVDEKAQKESRNSLVVAKLLEALDRKVRRPYAMKIDVEEKWVQIALQLEEGVFYVSLPQRRLFSSTSYIVLLWMIGTSILMLTISILFMRNQIRPIRRLAIAADRIGKGLDVPGSFKPEGAREVRQAAQAFINMHERIRRQIQQRTAMLSGVSHDLRTPLTRMKLQAAMLDDTPDVAALKSDIADMEKMLNAYLDFARGEGGEQPARVNLEEILERLCNNIGRQGADIDLTTEGDLHLHLRPVAFERCLANIISNARKYGERIAVAAVRHEDNVTITVDDNGPGIPADQYEEMFKPFVRGEPSRNPSTGGVGLGLAIVQDIVHAHGGQVWLDKSPLRGLRVSISLPL